MLIDNCRVPKILVDGESSINILYGGALDMMDTPKTTRAMISSQTQSHLYGLTGMRHSPGTISLPVRADPYKVITEFYVVDVEPP